MLNGSLSCFQPFHLMLSFVLSMTLEPTCRNARREICKCSGQPHVCATWASPCWPQGRFTCIICSPMDVLSIISDVNHSGREGPSLFSVHPPQRARISGLVARYLYLKFVPVSFLNMKSVTFHWQHFRTLN